MLAQNAGIEFETACGRITYLNACDFFIPRLSAD